MRDLGLVTEITPSGLVKILPVIDGACLSCTVTGCAKRGKPFFVTNPQSIPLEVGSHVKVVESKKHQAIQTIVNVFIPIIIAVATYVLLATQTHASDGAKAGLSLLALFTSCLILFFISAKRKLVQSEIVDTVEDAPPSK